MHRPTNPGSVTEETRDGLLFCGNPHESVPRALLCDDRLTPLERNAWQIIRMQVGNDAVVTTFPTYNSLRPYLTSMPCGGRASDETVARALMLLRLTRWLSLVRHRRRARDGRIQGNLYVLHDEPLAPNEAIQLDPHYLSLVSDALTHASKAIQRVGFHVLKELASDPVLSGRTLPSRLQRLSQRIATQGGASETLEEPEPDDPEPLTAKATIGKRQSPDLTHVPIAAPSSESEEGQFVQLRIPKEARTVRTEDIYKDVRTVPRAREAPDAHCQQWLARLPPEQRLGALTALDQLAVPLREAVLTEWASRCSAATVRHPARYLFGLIQRALRGQFNMRTVPGKEAADGRVPLTPTLPSASSSTVPAGATAHRHIEALRQLLRIR